MKGLSMRMSRQTPTLYPDGVIGAPKHRRGHAAESTTGLPAGTEVFSADNHISVADDIFYEHFPDDLKDYAPRIWYEDGAYLLGRPGQSMVVGDFSAVLMQYDDLAGAVTNNIDARVRELAEDGVDKELVFPNAVLALFHYPDRDLRERILRVYNEHIAEVQERSNGHCYGVGLINWWDPRGTRRTLAELKSLGLKTFLMPLSPGNDDSGNAIDYSRVAMMVNIDSFREMFSKYIFGGILDRHPRLRVGWFEGGIAWVPPTLQDAEHVLASYRHMLKRHPEREIRYYWDTHMCASFMVDGLGLNQIDEIGIDKVMWSSDYPHNESTFGYSERSLAAVVDAVGPEDAVRVVSGNIRRFLGV